MRHFSGRKKFVFIPLIAAAALFIISGIVMLLWNAVLPAVLGVHAVTYWQAMGILALCKVLFGFHGGRPGFGARQEWKKRMRQNFENMTPEDKLRFKEEFKRRAAEWKRHPGGWQPPMEQEQDK